MLQVLADCLERFCRKDIDPFLRSYIETVISLAFFRLPFFNKIFLNCFFEDVENEVITEWQGVDWDINEDAVLKKDVSGSISHLFNWKEYFFDHLDGDRSEATKLMNKI